MSQVKIQGNASGTGIFTVVSPNSNTDRTLTLPDASGTVLTTATPGIPVNGPAFSAYQSSAQALTAGSVTVAALQTKEFDTGTCFNNSASSVTLNGLTAPAYSFCPNVAGYYQVTGAYTLTSSAIIYATIAKNGSTFKVGTNSSNSNTLAGSVSCLVYLNGSGDYVQFRVYSNTNQNTGSGVDATYFQAAMIRGAQ